MPGTSDRKSMVSKLTLKHLLLSCGLLLVGCGGIGIGQPRLGISMPASSDQDRPARQLQLSTTMLKQEYCDRDHIRLKLRLRFTNVGSETLVVYRHSLAISRQMISRNYNDALEHRYLKEIEPFVDPILPPPADAATPDDGLFVTLKPGETHEVDNDVHVLAFDSSRKSADLLRPGHYFLQITVPTWWFSRESADRLRDRWRDRGFLWTQDLTSVPSPINVEKSPKVINCSQASTR